nr:MAG TPA: hypothetical protein [Caudoviricetes sp.]
MLIIDYRSASNLRTRIVNIMSKLSKYTMETFI